MSFEHPWLLLALPLGLIPFVMRLTGWKARIPYPGVSDTSRKTWRVRSLAVLPILQWATFTALVLAAAGPYTESRTVYEERYARDFVIALDTSESMRGVDFGSGGTRLSRLEGGIDLCTEFIHRREGDRIGLVVFGGSAMTQCPLTFDRNLALQLLNHVKPQMAGRRTALGEGVLLAAARLRERGGAVIVLSDGENTAGNIRPEIAARRARNLGVKIYSIGLGSDGKVPIPVHMPSGRTVLREKDYSLDEEALKRVASIGGGKYYRASDVDTLAQVFQDIDRLETKPTPEVKRLPIGSWRRALIFIAAVALGFLMLLSSVFLRTAPRMG
ncbi:MAG: VWA domain-containing protein [Candidatus Brocadiia bacterium]